MRRIELSTLLAGLAAAIGLAVMGSAVFFLWTRPEVLKQWTGTPDDRVQAHVTVYLEPPILTEGGMVLMAGRSMPDADWRALPAGANPAASDPDNPKRAKVKPGDRHFGMIAASPITVVEFFYPESGSYTFNFLRAKGHENEGAPLRTELVSYGSASLIPDPETGAMIDWPSTETVVVLSKTRDAGWARGMHATMSRRDEKPDVAHFEGGRTISDTLEQVARAVEFLERAEPAPNPDGSARSKP